MNFVNGQIIRTEKRPEGKAKLHNRIIQKVIALLSDKMEKDELKISKSSISRYQ
jgi:hypothetical protein